MLESRPRVARLRTAGPADAPGIADVIQEALSTYAQWAGRRFRAPRVDSEHWRLSDWLLQPGNVCVVAEAEFEAIGHVWIYAPGSVANSRPAGRALLSQLYVRPRWWGTGLASRLMEAAVAEAQARAFESMHLWTPTANIRARRFYLREGWAETRHRRFDQPLGLELTHYERSLVLTRCDFGAAAGQEVLQPDAHAG